MALCGVCRKAGHYRGQCPVLNKAKAAEIELQLRHRRYALEAVNTVTELLKVPMVTAGVWFALSRNEPTLGVLNKAMLAAELAPIIGDIKFPEGVLLGAAMESTEDFIDILNKANVIDATYEALHAASITAGGTVADFITAFADPASCSTHGQKVWKYHLKATGRKEGPGAAAAYTGGYAIPVVDDNSSTRSGRARATIKFGLALLTMKKAGCARPTYPYFSDKQQWADI